jgi:ATP phosphoribosyltransferase regulatory subunit HisZ
MKHQVLAVVAFIALSSGACFAQKTKNEKQDTPKSMESIVKDLGLNEKQAKEFKSAFSDRETAKTKEEEYRESRKEMNKQRKDSESIIKSILTKEQYKKYESLIKKNDKIDKQEKKEEKKKQKNTHK